MKKFHFPIQLKSKKTKLTLFLLGVAVVVGVQVGVQSTNAQWSDSASSGLSWDALDAHNGVIVAAANGTDIFRSDNNGASWSALSFGAYSWTDVAISTNGSGRIFAVSSNSNDMYFLDGVVTGARPIDAAAPANFLTIAASGDGNVLATAAYGGYVYVSLDAGQNWTRQDSLGTGSWRDLVVSYDGTKMMAIKNDAVHYSSNSGSSWNSVASPGGDLTSIGANDNFSIIAIAVNGGSVYTSINQGTSWQQGATGNGPWTEVVVYESTIYAAQSPGYLYRSDFGSDSWPQQISAGHATWSALTAYTYEGYERAAAAVSGSIIKNFTIPYLVAINSDKANGTYGVDEVIDINITFSEQVTSSGNITVTLETGVTDRTCNMTIAGDVIGTCNYTVQVGDESADLTVASLSGTVTDSDGNLVDLSIAVNLAENKDLVIEGNDVVAPTITSVSSDKADGTYTVGEVIDIDVTFSEAVTSTEAVTVTLETSDTTDATCTFEITDSTTGTCDYIVQVGDLSPDLSVSNISGTIADASANAMSDFSIPNGQNLEDSKAIVIVADSIAPTITSVSSDKANGSYTVGEVIDIDVTFSEAVTSNGDVTVTLNTGGPVSTCTFEVSNSITGTCDYTVQAGENSSDLTVGSISGIITDQSSNAIESYNIATNLAANKALVIDTTAPTVHIVSSDKAAGQYKAGEVIDIDVAFSEAVTSTGNVTVTLETGATDRTCTFTVSNETTGTCNYTVQAGDTSADLTVASISGTIADQVSIAMVSYFPSTNLAANESLVIDTTAPSVSITAPTEGATVAGAAVSITANASDTNAIVGVQFKRDTNTAIGAEDTTSTYGVTWDTTALADGAQSLIAVARDTAGNYATSTAINVTVDNTAPTAATLTPLDSAVDVAIDANLVIEFSENVDRESGNIVIYDASNDSAVATIAVTDGQVTGTGTDTITINPTADLSNGTTYYIQIATTAFDDAAGNSYAGIANTTSWNFTTVAAASAGGAGGGGGSSSSDIDVSCDVSDTTPSVGDEVDFEVDIDNADDYSFSWTAVLSGRDETDSHTFDEAGKFYPRGQIRTDDGNITVNCGTITVSDDGDDDDDNDTDIGGDEDEDDTDEDTGDDDTNDSLITIVKANSMLLLELLAQGVDLPEFVRDILRDLLTDTTTDTPTLFTVNLELGMDHPDVLRLQQFLNARGFLIATTGPGSMGNETTFFGPATQNALIRFQIAYTITPAIGFFGPVTRAFVEGL